MLPYIIRRLLLIIPTLFAKNNEFYNYKKKLDINWKKCLESYHFVKNNDQQNRLAMMLLDSTIQLSSVGLRGCDLMSMYHSVETRSVFLRKDIVKFALNLPLKFKIDEYKNFIKKSFLETFSS